MATATPLPTPVSTTTAREALRQSPKQTPITAIMATPAPTAASTAMLAPMDTPTTAKCTTTDLRSSTGQRDKPTQKYLVLKCDEIPSVTSSKLPQKRPALTALSVTVLSYHLLRC